MCILSVLYVHVYLLLAAYFGGIWVARVRLPLIKSSSSGTIGHGRHTHPSWQTTCKITDISMQTSGIRPRHCPTFGPREQPHRLRLIAQDDGIVTWNLRCYDWQLQATTYQESIQKFRGRERERGRGREVGRKIEINPLVHILLLTSRIRRLAKCHLRRVGTKVPFFSVQQWAWRHLADGRILHKAQPARLWRLFPLPDLRQEMTKIHFIKEHGMGTVPIVCLSTTSILVRTCLGA